MVEQKTSAGDTVSAVPAKNPKGAGRKRIAAQWLYLDLSKWIIPAHSPIGRMKKQIVEHLSSPFLEKPSPFAQTLIDGLAANIIMSKHFQASFLRGNKIPASILRDYTGLWNSISRDLSTLSGMAKESGVKDPVPSLEEYLEVVKKEEGKRLAAAERVPVPAEPEPSPPAVKVAADPSPKPEPVKVKTLF
jgi:hypothetical protein